MVKLFKKSKPKVLSLRDFHKKRETILFMREVGGLGDILMHRMMFEDFKRVFPDCRIVWAVHPDYLEAAQNHPFVDEVVDFRQISIHDYIISYNTTTACGRYETKISPNADMHRSDIWANHCGVLLTKHNMHLNIEPEAKMWAIDKIEKLKGTKKGPSVVLCPISAQIGKNLSKDQMMWLATYLHHKGCFVFGLHTCPIFDLNPFPTVWGICQKQWMAIIDTADYVVSVDTSAFHCAGGLRKPLMGIFTYICGLTYGKYYDFVLVQKHRQHDPSWTCGPCFNWPICPKSKADVKPCLTEINNEMLTNGVEELFKRFPLAKHT